MTPHKQLNRHRPDDGVIGDCWRTCIACLLDLPPSAVPHFVEPHPDDPNGEALKAARAWLREVAGLTIATFALRGTLDEVLSWWAATNPSTHAMLGGTSRNGVGHSVIVLDAAIVHDPALDDSGIVGPMADGLFWFELLVKA